MQDYTGKQQRFTKENIYTGFILGGGTHNYFMNHTFSFVIQQPLVHLHTS